MTEISEAVASLLEEGRWDWVSLQEVIWYGTHGETNPVSKERVVGVLEFLFGDGLMEPGELGDTGFEVWSTPRSEWTLRVREQLDALNGRPMGDGCWLRLTAVGEQAAETRQKQTC